MNEPVALSTGGTAYRAMVLPRSVSGRSREDRTRLMPWRHDTVWLTTQGAGGRVCPSDVIDPTFPTRLGPPSCSPPV